MPKTVDSPKLQKYTDTLAQMVRLETVSNYDKTDMAPFDAFRALLPTLFPKLFSAVAYEEFDGSILLRWKGSDANREPILLMNHHDVVEANGEWSYPPFSGTVAEGKLWGRGTLDTKGGLFCMLQAAEELIEEGFVPPCDIYFESACNEETDGKGARTIADTLQKRGLRFSFVLDEGGMILYEPIGGAKGYFAMVGMGEKGCAELRFIAKGSGGHSSTPERNTPLVRLGKFMAEIDDSSIFDVQVTPVFKEMLIRLSPSVEGALGTVFAHPDIFKTILKRVTPKISATAKAMMQTTVAFTMASGSDGRNVIPTEASVIASMRVAPHQGFAGSLSAIKRVASKYDLETEVLDPGMDSPVSDFKGEGFGKIERAVARNFKDVKAVPYLMVGASDGRYFASMTDQCFRFVPFLIDDEQLASIHGVDECVDLSAIEPAVRFYKDLMKEV